MVNLLDNLLSLLHDTDDDLELQLGPDYLLSLQHDPHEDVEQLLDLYHFLSLHMNLTKFKT